MLKQWISGATLSLAMLALTACGSKPSATVNGVLSVEPVTIHSRIASSSEKLTDLAVYLINDATTLENIGAKELSDINVDFDTQSLIVLSLGERKTGGYWAHIEGVQLLGDTIIVQGTANMPAEGAMSAAMINYPFEAVVVNKVNGTPVPDITSVQGQEHPSDAVTVAEPTPAADEAPAAEETQPAAE